MPPQCCSTLGLSIFAEWGLDQSEYSSRGVPSNKSRPSFALSRNDESRPRSRETGMKEATKRAASEALAQMLAVTAMLVIASVVFYWRVSTRHCGGVSDEAIQTYTFRVLWIASLPLLRYRQLFAFAKYGTSRPANCCKPRGDLVADGEINCRHGPSCESPPPYRPARCCRAHARGFPASRRGRPARWHRPSLPRWRASRPGPARRRRRKSCGGNIAARRRRRRIDRRWPRAPVVQSCEFLAHRTRSRNMLTCDDSTPPSPCSSAIEASRTWRLPARPVICRWVSTRCAIAPPTPQWP